jgi:hypothetical protein
MVFSKSSPSPEALAQHLKQKLSKIQYHLTLLEESLTYAGAYPMDPNLVAAQLLLGEFLDEFPKILPISSNSPLPSPIPSAE